MGKSTVTDSQSKDTLSSASRQQSKSASKSRSQSQQRTSGTSRLRGQSQSTGQSSGQSRQQTSGASQRTEKKLLDSELMRQILDGLTGAMTDEQISAYAENLLRPQLNAGIEAARQGYEATKLAKEQEIANLAASLERSIGEQKAAYRQNAANVETAALARGMGRSSYTLETLAQQGNALASAVRQLTDENARQRGQVQAQITQAAQHNAATQGRLDMDYASQLAAKKQELMENGRKEHNSAYLTAISSAMGQQTAESQTGSSLTAQTGTTTGITSQRQDGATTQASAGMTTGMQQTSGTSGQTTSQQSSKTSHSTTGDAPSTGASSGDGSSGGGGGSRRSSKKKTSTTASTPSKVVRGRYSAGNTLKIR